MRVFLFDIGNVLCNFDFDRLLKTYEQISGKPVGIHEPEDQRLYNAVETGEITDQEYVERMNERKQISWEVEDLVRAWQDIFSANGVGRSLYYHAIDQQVPVFTLSNIAEYHIKAINRNWDNLLDQATGLFLSYQMGYRKPHPKIYEATVDYLNVSPEECFFVDDLPENVEAARALGIEAHLFLPQHYDRVVEEANQFFAWDSLAVASSD
tara:strand:+ start:323 stop:952 length:630 start_codon:yes stop_codon:yes gene_type:complete